MFGHKHLLTEGIPASAVVLNSKGYDMRGDSGGYGRVHIDLEVHFADGTSATMTLDAKTADVDLVFPGQIVPVHYDDNDHSKVEIDIAAMKAQRTAHDEALRAYSIKRARAELANAAAPGASGAELTDPAPPADELRDLQPGEAFPTLERIRRAGHEQ